ncbi:phage tail terminator protein [Pseudomonas aeruginosa]|uniref:phage tail terminator protein n=1 Tax=Pseudomonas aeruginosa TaxID=287 RepID=UPI003D6EC4C2
MPEPGGLGSRTSPPPAFGVVYLGDEIGTGRRITKGRRAIQAIGQQWAVVLVVHYADSSNSGEGGRAERQDRCWDGWSRH